MEVKDYYNFVKRNWLFIFILPVLFSVAIYIVSAIKPDVYQSSASIEVIRKQAVDQEDVSYYQYDDYYARQAANVVSDNIIGWLSTASTVAEVYQKAGFETPKASISDLAKTFTTEKHSGESSVVAISYSDIDRQKAEKMISTASEMTIDRIKSYNRTEGSDVFTSYISEPVVIIAPKMELLNAIIALFVGFVIAISAVSIKEALK